MNRLIRLLSLAVVTMTLSGCKLIMDDQKNGSSKIPADQSGDKQRNAIRLKQSFDSKLLPHIKQNALPLSELQTLVAKDLAAAGAAHANRGAGRGAAWNFPVRGEGIVVEAKLDTRARWINVDSDGDGNSDIKVQLGPVIRGTALRDIAPFFNFDDFRDQIEFAKLSRSLNDKIKPLLVVPEGELVGKTVRFVGVTPLKSAKDKILLTPISIEFSQ